MEIQFFGHSCFRLKFKKEIVVTDPFDSQVTGLKLPKINADIVTVSHQHQDHNNFSAILGTPQRPEPFLISGPGEYEIGEIRIIGISSFHDKKKGKERGKNTIYLFESEGLRLVHLGDLGEKLTEEQLEELEGSDIVFVPVGGKYTLSPQEAKEVITQINPSIVIPMHYALPGMKFDLEKVEDFLEIMGIEKPSFLPKLIIKGENLPEEREVIVLNARG
ncbi:MAG: MBL fold metallo-hydrolase [Microgenomates group bacterium]